MLFLIVKYKYLKLTIKILIYYKLTIICVYLLMESYYINDNYFSLKMANQLKKIIKLVNMLHLQRYLKMMNKKILEVLLKNFCFT